MPDLGEALVYYAVFLLSTTLHEGAHAWAAKRGGDLTAYHGGQVSIEAYSDNPGDFTFNLYNWKKKTWDWLGKTRLESKDKSAAFVKGNPADYIEANGEVRVQAYRKEKVWNGFEMNVDTVQIKITEKKETPPPDKDKGGDKDKGEDKSLGDKAKDAWKNLKKKW